MSHKEIKLYSTNGYKKYRVLKSYDKTLVNVVEHDIQINPAEVIVELCGENGGRVYEVQGREVWSTEATGKYRSSIKELAEIVQETIDERGYF